jgi:hypothetical protein
MFEILFDLVVRWINAESFLFDQTRGKKKKRWIVFNIVASSS